MPRFPACTSQQAKLLITLKLICKTWIAKRSFFSRYRYSARKADPIESTIIQLLSFSFFWFIIFFFSLKQHEETERCSTFSCEQSREQVETLKYPIQEEGREDSGHTFDSGLSLSIMIATIFRCFSA